MSIQCEIVSQDRLLYEGEVDIIVAPGTEGELGILPNHAPLLTALGYGVLRIRRGESEQIFTIAGGFMEVRPDSVTVLADVGERVEEIDETRAEQARARAQALIEQGPGPDLDQYLALEASLRRSNLRLQAIRRYRRGKSPQIHRGEGE